jgi:hypothetical protein
LNARETSSVTGGDYPTGSLAEQLHRTDPRSLIPDRALAAPVRRRRLPERMGTVQLNDNYLRRFPHDPSLRAQIEDLTYRRNEFRGVTLVYFRRTLDRLKRETGESTGNGVFEFVQNFE